MPQYGWTDSPAPLRRQVQGLVSGLRAVLGPDLLGVYLHGSLSMGCFNPQRSDVDLLAVSRSPLRSEARPQLARLFLQHSGVPAPVEFSLLHYAALHPWQHPAPYEFHYSEDWRDRMQAHLTSSTWPEAATAPRDPDLAAHLTLARARGLALWGPLPVEVLPDVPAADYTDSIVGDFHWGRGLLGVNPVYFVLNACRVRAFLAEGLLTSKQEGGDWGLRHLPPVHAPLIRQALRAYRGELASEQWDKAVLQAFAEEMAQTLARP